MYKSLNDASLTTGNSGYERGNTRIWYSKPEFRRDLTGGSEFLQKHVPHLWADMNADLSNTHIELGRIQERDPGRVYIMMQGEAWSPRGEANNLIRSKGLVHTSMLVGDVIQVGNTKYFVESTGFSKLARNRGMTEELLRLGSEQPHLQPHLRPILDALGRTRQARERLTKTEKQILLETLNAGLRGKSFEGGLKSNRHWGKRVSEAIKKLERKGFLLVETESHDYGRRGKTDIHTTHHVLLTEEGLDVASDLQDK